MNTLLKRIIAIGMAMLMFLSLETICMAKEYASTGYQIAVANKATPTIDGIVNKDEGWGNAVYLNDEHATRSWGANPMMASADIYFAYSDDGVYFAVDLTEITTGVWRNGATGEMQTYTKLSPGYDTAMIESTGLEVAGDDSTDYAFNGDVICFTIDPLGMLEQDNFDNLTRYNISLVNGETQVYRTVTNNGDITDQVDAVCTMDFENNKMVAECFIPWEIICDDLDAETFGTYSVTPEEMSEYTAESRAMITYMDRFIDPEQEGIETFSRYMTVCQKTWDGRDAMYVDSAYVTRDYGIIIYNGECAHINTTKTLIQEATHTQKGYYNVHCNDCKKDLDMESVARLENPNPFVDVPAGKWFTTPVANCYACGYIGGTAADKFSPNVVMTRAMTVQILAKICGADLTQYGSKQVFGDVPCGKWFTAAVEWASENGITGGTGNNNFSPNGQLTREQLCLMLYKAANLLGVDTSYDSSSLGKYADSSKISSWAYNAMCWAYEKGLISGTSATMLSPKTMATRAQIAVIIINFDDQFITYPTGV